MKYYFQLKDKKSDFEVVRFSGEETMNDVYKYEIEFISKSVPDILMKEAEFRLTFGKYENKIHGLIAEMEIIRKIRDYYYCKAVLTSRFYKLNFNITCDIYTDKNIIEVFDKVLKNNGFSSNDYKYQLYDQDKIKNKKFEFIVQYNESDFNFIKRWCERMGIYFYFEQEDQKEVLVFSNSNSLDDFYPYNNEIYYMQISGVEGENIYKSAQEIVFKKKEKIKQVILRDYNYQKSDYDLEVKYDANKEGKTVYISTLHYETKEEGEALAKIIGQSLDKESEKLYITSTIPNIFPGYYYYLKNYFLDVDSGFVTETRKKGSGETFLNETKNQFECEFTMLPGKKQYRKELSTPKPEIKGILLGKIHGQGDTPFLDEKGRYKVSMPYILSDSKPWKISSWIRFAAPTAGGNKGFHFPLKKNTEVALAFVNGDPDRPVIIGTLFNSSNPNVVNAKNSLENVIESQKKMKIVFDDNDDLPNIKIMSPSEGTYIRIT